MKQVPFVRSSLNHDDVFILDTQNKIYQFNGANSNIQERAKALEVVQFLKEKYHDGTCDVAIVDDGKLDTESDSGEFWLLFGGFAPIGKKVISGDDIVPEAIPPKLYSIADGEVKMMEGELSKSLLENDKCFLLDCGDEIFVWVGRVTQVDDRKSAGQAAEDFICSQSRPKATLITRVIQGYETHKFKSKFESWPLGSAVPAEEGRGKVAALLKQQGGGVKSMTKGVTINEEVPPLLEGGGKMEVWCINGSAKTPLPKEDIGKFYSGDCYITLYTFHSGERKEEYFLCYWVGEDSTEEDQKMAAQLVNTISNSLKGRPVQGRISQGKEPPQFVALFQPMVVLKGGLSSGYKKHVAEIGLIDGTYTNDCVALIRISATSIHNNKALQVDAVATSLNSTECFLLQLSSSIFTWHGNQSTVEQHQLAAKVANFLKPGATLKHAKEGTESSAFWSALGGKQAYNSKKHVQETLRDPHLFTYSTKKGKFEVEEVYNFSQDDLLTEDMLILDTHAEVFVWVGQSVDSIEKQSAFDVGQRYINMATALENLAPNVPLYKVTEGNEPCFFTTYFSWDSEKATVQGNSFQKKVAVLFGVVHAVEERPNDNQGGLRQRAEALAALTSAFNSTSSKQSSVDKSDGSSGSGPRQRAEALAALNSAFSQSCDGKASASRPSGSGQGSQRAAAVAALSSVLTVESGKRSPETSPMKSTEKPPSEINSQEDSQEVFECKATDEATPFSPSNMEDPQPEEETEQDESENPLPPTIFSYDQLKAKSENPVTGIDFKRREAYLSEEEFQTVLGETKEKFYKLPRWKQDMLKKKADLF
ncbi:hypothetical protein SAY86_005605 [Trapa natans]|uniref:HP domain-containing protein n=1 Tax=Trapa natans TaxID=22666 RepID=A0AAN7L9J1_TRANT|nr:hypothetical protein SAY86_005605 [Trapa natans]